MQAIRRITATVVAICALALSAAAQGDATPAGKWTMSLKSPHGPMTLSLEVKLDGKKATGWLSGEQFGRAAITGEYTEGKLTFSVDSEFGAMTFVGKLKDKDTLVGDLSSHAGDLPCTATRVKEQ